MALEREIIFYSGLYSGLYFSGPELCLNEWRAMFARDQKAGEFKGCQDS